MRKIILFLALLLCLPVPASAGTGTAGDPYTSLTEAYLVPSSGRYFFNLGSGTFQADVDTSEGGGWVLVLQYKHRGGTNPPLSVLGAGSNLPQTSSSFLGDDESGIPERWGHAGNAAMSQFGGDIETRWFSRTSGNSRVIHFRTSLGDNYFRTGFGSMAGVDTSFTSLSGATATLPAAATEIYTDQGDYAFTNFPFWRGGVAHWGIKGNNVGGSGADGFRWESDDFVGGSQNNTVHRIWVRQGNPGVVTNTNDAGPGSLRDAINYANARSGADTISFNIPGTGPHTINLASSLPVIADNATTIDGITQSGSFCGNPLGGFPIFLQIRLNGQTTAVDGLRISGQNSVVRGLSLTGFANGITAQSTSQNLSIRCNMIGLAPDATAAGNGVGVRVLGASTIVGGLLVGEANVISGNIGSAVLSANGATAMTVRGNLIGTNPTGTSARPNGGVAISHDTGSASWADITLNLISGNNAAAIGLQSGDTVVPSGSMIAIARNVIGINRTGSAALANGGSGIDFSAGTISNVTIGGNTTADRNIISGNAGHGIILGAQTGINIHNNYIGINTSGTGVISNSGNGIELAGSSNIAIGDGTSAGRNVIAGNGGRTVSATGALANITINGNYLGTNSSGNIALTNGGQISVALQDAIGFNGIAATGNISILNNVIGGYAGAQIEFVEGSAANITITGNNLGVGANGTSQIVSNPNEPLIHITGTNAAFSNLKIGGTAAGEGNLLAFGASDGIFINSSGTNTRVIGNTIRNNARAGVLIPGGSALVSIYQNSIFSNGGIGIDLGTGGVTPNDAGDGDAGANNLLNFPTFLALNAASGGGLSYRFNLDVPAEANGYRIDFYRNSAADPTGFGEGEVWLGSIDTPAHPGGSVEYIGTLTPLAAVAAGNFVSATATRKTGASSYAETSEFNQNATVVSPMVVTNTADSGAGSLRNAITFANSEPAQDAITFNIPGSGVQVITVASALPDLVDTGITIDGSTQAGASCGDLWAGTPPVLTVRIDGVSRSFTGLAPTAADQLIKGLSITGFANGIVTRAASSNARVQCNFIGLAPDGTASANGIGVIVFGGNAVIGGLNAGEGNVVSGNNPTGIVSGNGATAMAVRGNFIGTDPLGLTARANTEFPLSNSNGTASWSDITRNLISGNGGAGIGIQGNDVVNPSAGTITIAGNYIGTNRAGTAALGNGGSGIDFSVGTISNLTIGGTTAADRNIISGNAGSAVVLGAQTGARIHGNYLGLNASGTAGLGNAVHGISLAGSSNISIGDGSIGGRNIISGNGGRALVATGAIANITFNRNFVGTDISGNTIIAGGFGQISLLRDAIAFNDITATGSLSVLNSVIGGYPGSQIEIVRGSAQNLTIAGNSIGVGANGTTPLVSNTTEPLIFFEGQPSAFSNVMIGGAGAGEGNLLAFGGLDGVFLRSTGSNLQVTGNTIRNNARSGVFVADGTNGAIIGNSIYSNGGLGIDLDGLGVAPNDPGDADTGANNLLNFPVIVKAVATGPNELAYHFTLDVPAAASGYRVEFFANTSADPSGHGEGEQFLGHVDVSHGGGVQTFTGTLNTAVPIGIGSIISATTTRRTAGGSWDITSEFSATAAADGVAALGVEITTEVFDAVTGEFFATPDNDLLLTATVTNNGSGSTDNDTLFAVISIDTKNSFFNDFTAGVGQAVGFTTTAPALTFTPGTDLRYSNNAAPPSSMAQCSYTPASGFDSQVRHVCLNPKGSLPGTAGQNSFSAQMIVRVN